MKKTILASILAASSFSAAAANTWTTLTTSVGPASGAYAYDTYWYQCTPGDTAAYAQLQDLAPVKPQMLSVQMQTSYRMMSKLSTEAFDTVDGDGKGVGTSILIDARAAGGYLWVEKTAYTGSVAAYKGAETYKLIVGCKSPSGVYVPAELTVINNQ